MDLVKLLDDLGPYVLALLALSEALALVPALKSNSVLQLFGNVLSQVAKFLRLKK